MGGGLREEVNSAAASLAHRLIKIQEHYKINTGRLSSTGTKPVRSVEDEVI